MHVFRNGIHHLSVSITICGEIHICAQQRHTMAMKRALLLGSVGTATPARHGACSIKERPYNNCGTRGELQETMSVASKTSVSVCGKQPYRQTSAVVLAVSMPEVETCCLCEGRALAPPRCPRCLSLSNVTLKHTILTHTHLPALIHSWPWKVTL